MIQDLEMGPEGVVIILGVTFQNLAMADGTCREYRNDDGTCREYRNDVMHNVQLCIENVYVI